MDLALFDFDGTISDSDSFLQFMRAARPVRFFRTCFFLSPYIALFLAKRYPNQLLKEAFLTSIFKGCTMDEINMWAEQFCRTKLQDIIRPKALLEIEDHKQAGARIVVVTASPRSFLEPWCRESGLEILGTELELDDTGKLSGKILGGNCRGEEKVRRIKDYLNLDDYESVSVYGDTDGDLAMLELASRGRGFYKPFRT